MNEKIAGLGFPDSTGRLDFNRGLEAIIQYSASGAKISLYFIGTKKEKKCRDIALSKNFGLQKGFSSQCRELHVNPNSRALLQNDN